MELCKTCGEPMRNSAHLCRADDVEKYLRSRVKELEGENAEAKKSHEDIFHQMEYSLNELLSAKDAECERLRGALRWMISEESDWDNGEIGVGAKFREKAREALSASEKSTGPAPTPAEKEEPDIAHGGTRCNCFSCQEDGPHKSDCAVHDGPAMPDGPCNCGLVKKAEPAGGDMISR